MNRDVDDALRAHLETVDSQPLKFEDPVTARYRLPKRAPGTSQRLAFVAGVLATLGISAVVARSVSMLPHPVGATPPCAATSCQSTSPIVVIQPATSATTVPAGSSAAPAPSQHAAVPTQPPAGPKSTSPAQPSQGVASPPAATPYPTTPPTNCPGTASTHTGTVSSSSAYWFYTANTNTLCATLTWTGSQPLSLVIYTADSQEIVETSTGSGEHLSLAVTPGTEYKVKARVSDGSASDTFTLTVNS